MNFKKTIWLSLAVVAIAAFGLFFTTRTRSQGGSDGQGNAPERGIIPHRTNPHTVGEALTAGSTGALSPITNHGGPVISGTVHTYVIWYGNWNQANGSDTPAGQQIVRDFLSSIGGSGDFNINTTYPGVSGAVTFNGETTDTGSRGTRLRDADVQTIVSSRISAGALPFDANGVYFVLTSSNVSEQSGFCTRYCGWHTAGNITSGHIRYSFVGNASRCISSCAAQSVGPNGNAGVDGMISVIAHELEEAVTDPDLNAWYDSGGAENADKCAWTFGGGQAQLASGAWYNVTLGTRKYLIQRNLQASDNKCYMSLNGQQ
ncbi:MAG TPA: hypothetical protein PK012_04470 [Blastocatellia bacterium]|nr:hypothetical protein [Blastocatellia bacterium]